MTITQNQLLKVFTYVEGKLYWRESRSNIKAGTEAGWYSNVGYRQVSIDGVKYLVHRIIFMMHHGYLPKYLDHINGDRADNRIVNLRECTLWENNWNAKTRVDNTAGVKGVCWHKAARKWCAELNVNGKKIYLGLFTEMVDAAAAIAAARSRYHGEFAKHK